MDAPESEPVPPSATPPPPIPPVIPSSVAVRVASSARPATGGSAWKWVAVLLALGLLASLAINLTLGARRLGDLATHKEHSKHGSSLLQEVVLEDDDSKNKVAVIEVSGVISDEAGRPGGSLVDSIRDQLDRAGDDEQVKASDEIYRAIHRFQTNTDVPVIASMGSIAASGGYYISAPCRWIVANELTITGSIGVIFHTYNYRALMDKVGVRPGVVKSGKLKDMLSPDKRPEDELPEERQILAGMTAGEVGGEAYDREWPERARTTMW